MQVFNWISLVLLSLAFLLFVSVALSGYIAFVFPGIGFALLILPIIFHPEQVFAINPAITIAEGVASLIIVMLAVFCAVMFFIKVKEVIIQPSDINRRVAFTISGALAFVFAVSTLISDDVPTTLIESLFSFETFGMFIFMFIVATIVATPLHVQVSLNKRRETTAHPETHP